MLPFCTLCGVATAYRATLSGPGAELAGGPLEFGTSGLLFRSNKLMHDRQTESLFEQFTGQAVTGPLAHAGAQLERIPLRVTSWRGWRDAHPASTVVAIPEGEDPSKYDGTFLDDRSGDTPDFPTGARDGRLAPRIVVLGVEREDATPLAFPVEAARQALDAGRRVVLDDVTVELDGDELVVRDATGSDLPWRQAFWFAWSQFHPDTELWSPDGG